MKPFLSKFFQVIVLCVVGFSSNATLITENFSVLVVQGDSVEAVPFQGETVGNARFLFDDANIRVTGPDTFFVDTDILLTLNIFDQLFTTADEAFSLTRLTLNSDKKITAIEYQVNELFALNPVAIVAPEILGFRSFHVGLSSDLSVWEIVTIGSDIQLPQLSQIPTPNIMALLSLGVLLLAVRRRK